MKAHARFAGTLLAAAVSMTTGEFVEVQKLSPDDLRTRFGLPAPCDPSVTALATDPAVNLVTSPSTAGLGPVAHLLRRHRANARDHRANQERDPRSPRR
jgi:hypothetical protein